MAHERVPLAERFWSKVAKSDGCWLWTDHINNKGYGRFVAWSDSHGRHMPKYAHRIAWELTHGPIAGGLNVLHRCDTPRCCNPSHLFLGTQKDNMRDCVVKGRFHANPNKAKVTPEQVRAIRADPRRHHIIAADYGLKRMSVLKIKHRQTWGNIE